MDTGGRSNAATVDQTGWPVAPPLRPMLLKSAPTPPIEEARVHEAKLDGWRCLVEVTGGRVQVWSRRGGDYTPRPPRPSTRPE